MVMVVESLNIVQLLSSEMAVSYTIFNYIAAQLFSWCVLSLSFYFFFATGAVLIFGSWVGMFSSLGQALLSTFLIFSKVPNSQPGATEAGSEVFSSRFWRLIESPGSGPLMWQVEAFFSTYQTSGIYEFAFWFSLVVGT
jgi:hypothetical protein